MTGEQIVIEEELYKVAERVCGISREMLLSADKVGKVLSLLADEDEDSHLRMFDVRECFLAVHYAASVAATKLVAKNSLVHQGLHPKQTKE